MNGVQHFLNYYPSNQGVTEKNFNAFLKVSKTEMTFTRFKSLAKDFENGKFAKKAANLVLKEQKNEKVDLLIWNPNKEKFNKTLFETYKTNQGVDVIFSTNGGVAKGSTYVVVGAPGTGKTTLLAWIQKTLQDNYKNLKIACIQTEMKKFDIGYEMIENEMKWMGEINYIMLKEYGYERLKSTLETIFSSGFDILFLDSIEDVVSKLKVYADMSQNEAENYVIDLMDKAADGKDNKGVHTTTLAIQQVTKGGEFKGDNKLKHMTTGMLHAYKDEKGERYLTFSKNRRCGGHQEKRLYYGLNDKKEIEFNLALFTQVEEEAKFMKQEQSKILEASKDFWSVVEKPAVIDLISVLNETSEEEEVGIEILDEA